MDKYKETIENIKAMIGSIIIGINITAKNKP
jgi:hypothetical protein